MRILLLSLGILFASELEVQGDLKVSGSIDAQNNPVKNVGTPQSLTDAINGNVLQDALREDGPFEYKTVLLRLNGENLYNNQNPDNFRRYKELESTNYIELNFDEYISSLSSEGYELFNISPPCECLSILSNSYLYFQKIN